MRTALAGSAGLALLLVLVGCGSDDAAPAADPTSVASASPSATPTGLVVTDGVSTTDLLACLTGAGLDATQDDSTPYGVEVPVETVRVEGMESYDGTPDQGASLYVFGDATDAAESADLVTLGQASEADGDRFGVHRNVVRAMDIILKPEPHTADEDALLGCLPS